MSSDSIAPGPNVLHGGFTSAFYEFGDDHGTGPLIISVACRLTRMEERLYNSKLKGIPLIETIPKLSGSYNIQKRFTHWLFLPQQSLPIHSILILEGSGSMEDSYASLFVAVNKYSDIQIQRNGIISVISFGNTVHILYEKQTRKLRYCEGYDDGQTDYGAALQLTIQVVSKSFWISVSNSFLY
jgi:hypothetical protein